MAKLILKKILIGKILFNVTKCYPNHKFNAGNYKSGVIPNNILKKPNPSHIFIQQIAKVNSFHFF